MSTGTLKRQGVKALKRESVAARVQTAASTLQHFNASTISIANRQRTKKINARLLKQVAAAGLADLEVSEAELGISLVSAKEMARVNWLFLQHEGSTDVITFDHREMSRSTNPLPGGGARGATRPTVLFGELFICVEDAVKQAKEFKTSWQSEVVRYVVHGVLHLVGHDDLKAVLRRKMKREENRLVRRLAKRFSLAEL